MLGAGERFANRYVVVDHIGAGGMGDVYRATDTELGEDIALKVLSPAKAEESIDWLDRFRAEVRLARKVTHKNVARIYDIGTANAGSAAEVHYMTMELVVGESLRRKMRGPPALTTNDALVYGEELAAGIAGAHDAGVVHGDLKPGNAMIEASTGRLVLIDFGLAKSVDDGREITDVVLGTPSYMAPEQLSGQRADAATDVYALGLVIFELVAHERPFQGDTGLDRARARVHNDAPDLRAFRPSTPATLAELVARCLSRDPQRRPAAADVARTLHAIGGIDDVTGKSGLVSLVAALSSGPSQSVDLDRDAPTEEIAPPPSPSFSLAVLPFHHDDKDGAAALADGVADTLRDLLALTNGLRVLPTEVARKLAGQQSGRNAGLELDVDALVEGTVSIDRAAGEVMIAVRLVDVESGRTLFADDLRGRLGDLLRVQDRAARKIAEELRMQITTDVYRHIVDDDAVERYLRARSKIRLGPTADAPGAYVEMSACVQKAPGFLLAHAGRAIAAVRASSIGMQMFESTRNAQGEKRDWAALAREAVEDAVAVAAGVPDTHFAAALLAQQEARFGDAIAALERALRLAPAFAEAHEMLGRLEMESGRVKDGAQRLFLAAELDPRTTTSLALVARSALFRGKRDVALRVRRRVLASPVMPLEHMLLVLRAALWRAHAHYAQAADAGRTATDDDAADVDGDDDAKTVDGGANVIDELADDVDVVRKAVGTLHLEPAKTLFTSLLAAVDGDPKPMIGWASYVDQAAARSRYRVLQHQLCVEVLEGDVAHALDHLEAADGAGLFDLEWLEHCPALAALRAEARFVRVRDSVARRVLRL